VETAIFGLSIGNEGSERCKKILIIARVLAKRKENNETKYV
jgi:hypothetical protein